MWAAAEPLERCCTDGLSPPPNRDSSRARMNAARVSCCHAHLELR